MITEDRSMTILIILIMAESRREGMGNARIPNPSVLEAAFVCPPDI